MKSVEEKSTTEILGKITGSAVVNTNGEEKELKSQGRMEQTNLHWEICKYIQE